MENFKFICLLVGVIASTALAQISSEEKIRAACAQVDFNNPTKITYWSPFAGIGPVSGYGIKSEQAQQMLSAALKNISEIDENRYRIDKINTAFKCIFNNDLYEFNANLIDKNDQNKSCVVQIYKNHEKTDNGSTTATVIACDDDPQYFKTYTEV
ncbi:uncharacterized protein LOC106094490 [Stomoxys calcitrans]|uniref:Cystatin domain-containing protein n=1 Tax=Stomoxys calcitrans TaxID=35570 RepID=A0A1I8NYH7_STOCA|nr:uncharacterized protein LOC106094490 [Stomoxys calcitrans]